MVIQIETHLCNVCNCRDNAVYAIKLIDDNWIQVCEDCGTIVDIETLEGMTITEAEKYVNNILTK